MWTRIEQGIDLLALVGRNQEIRQFACWVARQTNIADSADRKLVDNIARYTKFPDYIDKYCERLRARQRGKAIAATAVGLNHGCISAREYLCCLSCASPDPKDAATVTINHAVAWYQQVTRLEDADPFLELIATNLTRCGMKEAFCRGRLQGGLQLHTTIKLTINWGPV